MIIYGTTENFDKLELNKLLLMSIFISRRKKAIPVVEQVFEFLPYRVNHKESNNLVDDDLQSSRVHSE